MPTPFIISNPPVKRTENDDVLFENMVDRYIGRLVYTSDGDFVKANYPYARMVLVRVQGGGGAGGGAVSTPAGQNSGGAGGGSGAYAESWLETTSLAGSVPVTVGDAGTGTTGTGGSGTASLFGSLVSAEGGPGGFSIGDAADVPRLQTAPNKQTGGVGDFVEAGSPGDPYIALQNTGAHCVGGRGGDSKLGGGGNPGTRAARNQDAGGFGGGGGGSGNDGGQSARNGGTGGPGVVILELYA